MNNRIYLNNPKPKIVASIEARMTSSRFPGKMLAEIGGMPVIKILVERLKKSKLLDDIVIATTDQKTDDELAKWAEDNNVKVFRGSEDDVLLRVVEAHKYMKSDIIVEITGDCPFSDPDIIDIGISTFLANDCDYLTNCEVFSAPPGLYVQVFTYKSLAEIEKNINDSAVREHVSLPYYENPDKYKNIHLMSSPKLKLPEYTRIYLDYKEDFEFLNAVYNELFPKYGIDFNAEQITDLLLSKPELIEINRYCGNKPVR